RRRRRQVMEDFDAGTFRIPPRRWPHAASAVALCVALAAVVGSLSWVRLRHRSTPGVSATAGGHIKVRPGAGAQWVEAKDDGLDRIELGDGGLWLGLARPSLRARVLIAVPDGTIEDFGTTLRVRVAGGRTTAVDVEQGEVAVRLEGRPEMRL